MIKNDEKNIDKTITSILEQKFKNFEYIVVIRFKILLYQSLTSTRKI